MESTSYMAVPASAVTVLAKYQFTVATSVGIHCRIQSYYDRQFKIIEVQKPDGYSINNNSVNAKQEKNKNIDNYEHINTERNTDK